MERKQTNHTLKQSVKANDILKQALEEAMEEDISSVNIPVSFKNHESAHPSAAAQKQSRRTKRRPFLRIASLAAAACLLFTAGWAAGVHSPASSVNDLLYTSDNPFKSAAEQYSVDTNSADAYSEAAAYNYETEAAYENSAGNGILSSANLSDISESANTEEDASQPKIITTWNITGESLSFDEDIENLEALITELGGYTESSSLQKYNEEKRRMDYTIRIPSEQASSFLEQTGSSLHITAQSTSTENVTLQYYDTASRLEAYKTELATLNRLMEEAENISDVLEIESRISDLNYTIDSYESQLRTLDNQIEYTTFHISITEVSSPTETGDESILTRISNGFKNSASVLADIAVEIFVWFFSNIPLLAAAAAVIILVVVCIRHGIRRKNK